MKREEYLARSLSRSRPWEAAGVSRATWYRQRRETSPGPRETTADETSALYFRATAARKSAGLIETGPQASNEFSEVGSEKSKQSANFGSMGRKFAGPKFERPQIGANLPPLALVSSADAERPAEEGFWNTVAQNYQGFSAPPDPWWTRPVEGWPQTLEIHNIARDETVTIHLRGDAPF